MSPTLLQSVVRAAEVRTPDADLLARFARDHDQAAFEELVRRHGPLVWSVCRELLPHHADAEDAFQVVFLALVRGATSVRSGQALAAWLYGVAVRVATKSRRAAARRRQRERKAVVPEAERPVPDAAWAELMAAVHEEVARLPDPERTAFVLCDLEGVRQPDAASRLGWPLGTLSGRLCKARQRLLELLAQRGVAPGVLGVGGLAASAGSIPASLIEKVTVFPTATAAGVSATVAELARGLVEGVTMRTKLTAAALLVAGALGIGGGAAVLSNADAQPPAVEEEVKGLLGQGGRGTGRPATGSGSGDPLAGGDSGGGMTGGGAGVAWAAHPGVEHHFIEIEQNDREAFEKAIIRVGKEGWEFCGCERFESTRGVPGQTVKQLVLVFKRPKGVAAVGGMMGGGLGGGPGGMMGGRGGGVLGLGGMGGPGGRMGGGIGGAGENAFDVVRLENANAEAVVTALQKAFPTDKLRAVAEKQSNSVVIVSVDPAAKKDVLKMIESLDSRPGAAGGVGGLMGGSLDGMGGAPAGGGAGSFGGPGGMMPGGPGKPMFLNVLTLKNTTADDMAALLKQLFPAAEFAAHAATNSVIVRADEKTLEEARALVSRLEAIDPPKKR